MPTGLPIDESARARLRAAQKAEAVALCKVEAANVVFERNKRLLTKAEESLATAQADLVDVSGMTRAAVLLGVSVEQLQRAVKAAKRRYAQQVPPTADESRAPSERP